VNRAEILSDPSLTSAHARSLRLEEISQAESAAPTMAPLTLAPGQARRLRDMRDALVLWRDELATLDKREALFRTRLPDAQRKLDALESAVNPDDGREELLYFAVETIRLQLLRGFLGNFPEKRRAAENAVSAALVNLSRLCDEIGPKRQLPFMAGHTLEARVAIALSEIDFLVR